MRLFGRMQQSQAEKTSEKIHVAVLFGGQSVEHEISIISARNVIENVDSDRYEVLPIYITRIGAWRLLNGVEALKLEDFENRFLTESHQVVPVFGDVEQPLMAMTAGNKRYAVDVFFPLVHGENGEDGSLQGLLQIMNLPYVGCDVLSSSLCMDKDMTKQFLQAVGINVAPWLAFTAAKRASIDSKKIVGELGLPLFVKPAGAGSSIGISKVESLKDMPAAIDYAFTNHSKIIFESMVKGREIEVAVLGNDDVEVSLAGEILPKRTFYDYEGKYLDSDGAELKVPVDLPEKVLQKIQSTAKRVYQSLGCSGMARVDFFLTDLDDIVLNEVNTVPGFTSISMYPSLWREAGLPYASLLDKLIKLAIERFETNVLV